VQHSNSKKNSGPFYGAPAGCGVDLNVFRACAKMAALLALSQSPRDRVLWILTNNDDRMERSRLRMYWDGICTPKSYPRKTDQRGQD